LPPKVTATERCSIFGGQVIAAKSQSIFVGHPKPPKIILSAESNIYFWQSNTAENRTLPLKIAYFQWLGPIFGGSWPQKITVFPVVMPPKIIKWWFLSDRQK
jgi:hypothetical protein